MKDLWTTCRPGFNRCSRASGGYRIAAPRNPPAQYVALLRLATQCHIRGHGRGRIRRVRRTGTS